MVDLPDSEAFAGKIRADLIDNVAMRKFADDEVALDIRIGIRRVGDLEAEPCQREAGVFRSGANPEHLFVVVRSRLIGFDRNLEEAAKDLGASPFTTSAGSWSPRGSRSFR